MTAFTVNASVHDLDAGFIITPLDNGLTEFKIEMITGCLGPVIIKRTGKAWLIKQEGCIPFTRKDICKLGRQIEQQQAFGYTYRKTDV